MSERIAVITTSFPHCEGDAAGHFVASEVHALCRAGHDVHVFAPGRGSVESTAFSLHWLEDRAAFGWPGSLLRLRERPTRFAGVCEFAVRAELELRRHGPFSRILAHFLVPSGWPLATLVGGRTAAPKLELVGHGSDVRLFCALPAAVRAVIARAWLSRGASLRVTSHELAALIRAKNPELSACLRVEPSRLDLGPIETRCAARRALGIDDEHHLAVVVSRLVPDKRVAIALRALSLIPVVSVFVIGEGPERAALQSAFPRVRFTGQLPRPETLRYLAAADVLVSASEKEGAPSVVREARALGVPVVAVRAGDLLNWAELDPGLFVVQP